MNDRYASDDITFCLDECDNTDCFRHLSNMTDRRRLHSVARMKGSVYCPMEWKDGDGDYLYSDIPFEIESPVIRWEVAE